MTACIHDSMHSTATMENNTISCGHRRSEHRLTDQTITPPNIGADTTHNTLPYQTHTQNSNKTTTRTRIVEKHSRNRRQPTHHNLHNAASAEILRRDRVSNHHNNNILTNCHTTMHNNQHTTINNIQFTTICIQSLYRTYQSTNVTVTT